MFYNKVEICGVNTAHLPVLTDEEKTELLIKAQNGDIAAREKMIRGNLRLVLSIIQRFAARCPNLDDLFQVGCIGLIKAVENFDTSLGVKFSTYACPMIVGEVRRYLRDDNSVRVSRSVRDLAYKALQAREKLARTLSTDPTVEQIIKELTENGIECTKEEVTSAMEAIVEPVSLYDAVYSDGNSSDAICVMDQISDPDYCDDSWMENIALREAMEKLDQREKKIVTLRFFGGKTQMEIAAMIGISQAQVSRLEKGALQTIRQQLG